MIWKDDEIELLAAFIEAGYTHKEIALELGRTPGSVSQKAFTIELSSKNNQVKNHKQYIAELAEKCPTSKVLEKYVSAHVSILLVCGFQNKYRPTDKLQGRPCRSCNPGSGEINRDDTYLVYFPKLNIYKVGITYTAEK